MPEAPASWLRVVFGMGERRRLGDVGLDLLLFAGMVRFGASFSVYHGPIADLGIAERR